MLILIMRTQHIFSLIIYLEIARLRLELCNT